jgi:hypothetical protein
VSAERTPLERRLRLAGGLLVVGLLVETGTLAAGGHPVAFLLFAGVGSVIVVVGTLLYLHALVTLR